MSDRSYLSIGDVLNLLKDEFPDVTISKIRFLESQGLLDPERTPSGYRKFYDADVERLRWILRQQKEHFLPLKVIKGRLEPDLGTGVSGGRLPGPGGAGPAAEPADPAEAVAEPVANGSPAAVPVGARTRPETDERTRTEAPRVPAAGPSPGPGAFRSPPVSAPPSLLSVGPTGVSLTWEELLEASGLEEPAARDLERYGLIVGRPVARTTYYDEEALIVARLAADFGHYGVEARHLRMYKTAAERESGFFEQIVTPLLKQRNPRSRAEAIQTARDLSELGARLRQSMLRLALRELTGG